MLDNFKSYFQYDESWRDYINLDNAATTPPAELVKNCVNSFLKTYGSVSRGAGSKSLISTEVLEAAYTHILRFFGAGDDYVLIIGFNTTSAINRMVRLLKLKENDLVYVSEGEHTSNLLPWDSPSVIKFPTNESGDLDLSQLEQVLKTTEHQGKARIVACSAASNVTGVVTDIRQAAKIAHKFGAQLFIDAAQLVAHRAIDISSLPEDERPDYIAFSGHKMYAPYGFGAVLTHKSNIPAKYPDMPGGGAVIINKSSGPVWEQNVRKLVTPGTPNAVGMIAFSAAARLLQTIGFDNIFRHESNLIENGRKLLSSVDGLTSYNWQGQAVDSGDCIPIFLFNLEGFPHHILASRLNWEHSIAVRSGHLCQFNYMRVHIPDATRMEDEIILGAKQGDYTKMYGMVRASCGLENTVDDLEKLAEALKKISLTKTNNSYSQRKDGIWLPNQKTGQYGHQWPKNLEYLIKYRK